MHMAIDEPGHERLALQIDNTRARGGDGFTRDLLYLTISNVNMAAFAELTGINVKRGLGLLLSDDESKIGVRCGVAVVRVRNGVAEWVDVRRGQVNGNVIEVFGDLREGDVVVRRGNDEIRPGTRVSATPAKG